MPNLHCPECHRWLAEIKNARHGHVRLRCRHCKKSVSFDLPTGQVLDNPVLDRAAVSDAGSEGTPATTGSTVDNTAKSV